MFQDYSVVVLKSEPVQQEKRPNDNHFLYSVPNNHYLVIQSTTTHTKIDGFIKLNCHLVFKERSTSVSEILAWSARVGWATSSIVLTDKDPAPFDNNDNAFLFATVVCKNSFATTNSVLHLCTNQVLLTRRTATSRTLWLIVALSINNGACIVFRQLALLHSIRFRCENTRTLDYKARST